MDPKNESEVPSDTIVTDKPAAAPEASVAPAAVPPTATATPAASEGGMPEATVTPPSNGGKSIVNANDIGFLNDVSIVLTIEVGRTQIKIRDLLNLSKDSIIDLNKGSSEPVDIYANGKLISRGHIITANGKYCVRLASIAQNLTE